MQRIARKKREDYNGFIDLDKNLGFMRAYMA